MESIFEIFEIFEILRQKLDEKRQTDQDRVNNPDWWLHIKDKYDIASNYKCKIVVLHPCERLPGQCYNVQFSNARGEMVEKYLPESIPLDDITTALDEQHIIYKVVRHDTPRAITLDFINNIDSITRVIGFGEMCYQSMPCKHRLVVETDQEQELTIKYVDCLMIKKIYDQTGQAQQPHILKEVSEMNRILKFKN